MDSKSHGDDGEVVLYKYKFEKFAASGRRNLSQSRRTRQQSDTIEVEPVKPEDDIFALYDKYKMVLEDYEREEQNLG